MKTLLDGKVEGPSVIILKDVILDAPTTHTHTHRLIDRQTQTDRHTDTHTDRQTHRQTDRHTHRQTDRPTYTQIDRQTDRQTDTQTDRHTD